MTQSDAQYLVDNINLQAAILQSSDGTSVNISKMITDFTITENIFSKCITGSVSILDSLALIDKLPIIGEEFFTIRFKTPSDDFKFITKTFSVYDVTGRKRADKTLEHYTLNLVSLEGIVDVMTNFDENYTDLRYDQIVDKVYNDYIYKSTKKTEFNSQKINYIDIQAKKKELRTIETKNLQSILCNGESPFDFIQICTDKSQSVGYPDSDFIFYEDKDKFNFVPISYLLEQEPVNTFRFGDYGMAEDAKAVQAKEYRYNVLSQLEYNKGPNTIEASGSGLYGSSIDAIDLITKRFTNTTSNYVDIQESKSKFKNLDGNSLISKRSIFSGDDGSAHSQFLVGNIFKGNFTDVKYLKDRINKNNDRYVYYHDDRFRTMGRTVSKFSQLNNYSLSIAIPSNTNLLAGNVINIEMPNVASEEKEKASFQYLFGRDKESKFLITSVTHNFIGTEGRFYTILNVCKDSYFVNVDKNYSGKMKNE